MIRCRNPFKTERRKRSLWLMFAQCMLALCETCIDSTSWSTLTTLMSASKRMPVIKLEPVTKRFDIFFSTAKIVVVPSQVLGLNTMKGVNTETLTRLNAFNIIQRHLPQNPFTANQRLQYIQQILLQPMSLTKNESMIRENNPTRMQLFSL